MFTLRLEEDVSSPALEECAPVQVWRDLDDRICAHGYAGDGRWVMDWPGHATFSFGPAVGAGIVRASRGPGASVARVEETFRRGVLPLALQAVGFETLHASAISTQAGVIAFCGERRAGKSTVAYALARRGFTQHADDTLVLSVDAGRVEAVATPFAPRLRSASAQHFQTTTDHGTTSPAGSAKRRLAAVFVLSPRADAGAPSPRRLESSAAFQALLAHAHCFDPTDPAGRERLLRNYLEISSLCPVYELRYAPGLGGLDAMLDGLLAAAGVTGQAVGA